MELSQISTVDQLWTLATTWYSTRIQQNSRRSQPDEKAVTSTASSSDAVDGQTNNGLVINNNGNGLVEGGRHGITAGAADETVNFTLSLTNQLNATIQGDDGSGMPTR